MVIFTMRSPTGRVSSRSLAWPKAVERRQRRRRGLSCVVSACLDPDDVVMLREVVGSGRTGVGEYFKFMTTAVMAVLMLLARGSAV